MGGNTALGIDCSGLVQVACTACGIAAPADSDLQRAALGEHVTGDVERAIYCSGRDMLLWSMMRLTFCIQTHVQWPSHWSPSRLRSKELKNLGMVPSLPTND